MNIEQLCIDDTKIIILAAMSDKQGSAINSSDFMLFYKLFNTRV